MHLKKTLLIWISGILLIIVSLYYAFFGNFTFSNVTGKPEYQYYQEDIQASAVENGYEVNENVFTAQSMDSWFIIKLPRRVKIEQIELNVSDVKIANPIQIYYGQTNDYNGSSYFEKNLKEGNNRIAIEDSEYIKYLRFDLTSAENESLRIESIKVCALNESKILYFIFCPLLILIYMMVTGCYINREMILEKIEKKPKLQEKFELLDQILALAWSDFKGRFSGSYLGIFWGILQPLATILLFWFVFQVGFRSGTIDNVPFILWLAAGMIPWNFFYDAWYGGTSAFVSYAYIVKKVVFRIDVLPLVKVLSSFILNFIFNGILIVLYCIYGRFMGVHIFDMLYFSFCLFMLSLGLSYITATLNVFMKDIGQFMGIILQVLMWMTPMMWDYHMIPEEYSLFYKLNPLHYVVNGYRESLILGNWFYTNWRQMLWFWFVTILCLILGSRLMNRMKDHFADVL